MVGGDTSLLCYDVEQNKDVFFQDIKDGVHALTVGRLSSSSLSPSLCLVGGSSAVTGLDMMGVEAYWTAMSDSVGALCTRPSLKDSHELLVGTADRHIRILSASQVTAEMTEAAAVGGLAPLQGSLFSFSLTNGTVGVYNNHQRLWMAKSKHSPHSSPPSTSMATASRSWSPAGATAASRSATRRRASSSTKTSSLKP